MTDGVPDRFWSLPAPELLERLTTRSAGLSSPEAESRLARYGANTVAEPPRLDILRKIARRFAEPLVAILLIAAAISGLTRDFGSFAIILTVITLSIVLDLVQEHRAERAAEALKRSVAVQADVRRDGVLSAIPVDRLVPGDVVELKAGDLVPADGIVLECRNAHANEALMTGEPYPVDKYPGLCVAATPPEAFNALFAGTSIVGGQALMLVVATGRATRFGAIAAALAAREPPTAFQRGIHRLGLMILRLTIFLTLFVLLMNLAFARPVLESFLFAVALAVGLTPELLPMIMTVTLARGALRMAQKRVVVKKLAAIHDLGAMDVLCTDKTGTLTEARIALLRHPGVDQADSERVLTLAAVNSRFETGIRSPLDEAIASHSGKVALEGWSKIDEMPFDFERRRISVLVERERMRLLIVKGAPEEILARAALVESRDGQAVPIDARARATLEQIERDEAEQGNRVLAVAWKPMPADRSVLQPDDERDLIICGLCVFVDPPKPDAAEALQRLARAGVRVKILSGDGAAVVRHVAAVLGMPDGGLLTGTEVAELNDAALAARVEEVDLYARLSPDQKTRLVLALRRRGHTVGFLGDGVNDAPAIHAADVGLSVEGATEVARQAADMIMLERNLDVLAAGVEEGRRTFANILKYVRMATSSNFGNMLSMALASIFLPFLPLTPIQVLLNNLMYDLSEIGIPFDRVEGPEIARPRAWDMGEILRFTAVMGTLSSMFDMATFAVLVVVFGAAPDLFRTAWFLESIATQILVIFIIRTHGPAWRSRPHPALVFTSLAALAGAPLLVFSPIAPVLGFVAVPGGLILTIAAIVLAYLVCAELAKRLVDHVRTPRTLSARAFDLGHGASPDGGYQTGSTWSGDRKACRTRR
ncbi:MAG TPA: magnesium-translocating P-type ATPase [Xanthobacteraceae bacterium]|jgi:Mg2+-importing ATPase